MLLSFLLPVGLKLRPLALLLGLLLDLDSIAVTVGGGLDQLEDAVLQLDAMVWQEDERRVILVELVAERPSRAFHRRLDTVVITRSVQRDGLAETHSITFSA